MEGCQDAQTGITIMGEDVNHIKNVLRLTIGDTITVCDGAGKEYECEIAEISKEQVYANIVDINQNAAELPCNITLFQGMPKSDKMEFIIQKAVELGAAGIVPVMMKRTVVKLDLLIVPYESADGIAYAREIIAQASNLPDGANIGIFIGPEGGFAKEEIDVAKEAGAKIITLGNRILRTETAGLAVLSILMFQMEQ